jgi:hypothetical protein
MMSCAFASKGYLPPSQIAAQIIAFILKVVDGCQVPWIANAARPFQQAGLNYSRVAFKI